MKQIPTFPNYSVTKDGRVWSKKRTITKGGWLRQTTQNSGHLVVGLCKSGKRHIRAIHQLVLETFVGLRLNGMQCRHLNGNPADNRLENLKWGTSSENTQDAIKHGTQVKHWLGKRGEKCPGSKLSDQDRRLIFSVYHDGAYEQQELADHFSVGYSAIYRVVRNNRWAGATI